MYRPCTHIIIVQIMIDSVELNSITIYEHKIDLKLYGLTFKVENYIFFRLLKYNLIMNLNILPKLFITKKFLYLNKRLSQK